MYCWWCCNYAAIKVKPATACEIEAHTSSIRHLDMQMTHNNFVLQIAQITHWLDSMRMSIHTRLLGRLSDTG